MTEKIKHVDRREEILSALPDLHRFAISLSKNRHDGEDLLQTTVEKLLTKGVPNDADVKKWAFKICKNVWIDEIRARKVRLNAQRSGEDVFQEQIVGDVSVVSPLELDDMQRAMNSLPEDQRVVISLVAIEGCSYADAAEILDAPIGTIMSRLARGRKALVKMFETDNTPLNRLGTIEI